MTVTSRRAIHVLSESIALASCVHACPGLLCGVSAGHSLAVHVRDRFQSASRHWFDPSIAHQHGPSRRSGTARCCLSWRPCLLYTSDAADEEDSVDLGGS